MLLRRLVFFWIASFALATAGYGLLWLLRPDADVFYAASGYIPSYHNRRPLAFTAIPCFVYGICATLIANQFVRQTSGGQIGLTALIVVLTVLLSSPLGGILYYFLLKQAGNWPGVPWGYAVLDIGPREGLENGWFVILSSAPYSVPGVVVCFYLTHWGSRRFTSASTARSGFSP